MPALTPELDTERYLQRFRHKAWSLFREHLYDDGAAFANPDGEFSFDLDDERAPHAPLAIHWIRSLAAGIALRCGGPDRLNSKNSRDTK